MRFTLFLSNTYENAFLQTLNKLKESMHANKEKHFFVVPDRITLNAEKRIFEHLNIKSSFNIEVITLSKLANKVLGNLQNKKMLSKQSGILLTTKIVLKNKQKLKAFSKATKFLGFSSSIYETIMQLKSCNITVNELKQNESQENTALNLKMQDIGLLFSEYEKELEKTYLDASTKLNLFIEAIGGSEIVENAHFYFALFDNFTPQQYRVIHRLIKHAKSVNVGICANTKQNNANVYMLNMYENLTQIAKEYGMNIKDIIVNEWEQKKYPWQQHMLEHFYAYQKPQIKLNENSILLFEAKTIKEEVEVTATHILKLVEEKGLRYKDVSIALTNLEEYSPIIKEVFESRNIPYYLDESKSLLENHYVIYLLKALEVMKNNFLNVDVISFSKNYFLGLENLEKNVFEDVVLKYGIDHKQFLSSIKIDDEQTEKVEQVRKKIMAQLSSLFLKNNTNKVSVYVDNLTKFIEENKLEEKLTHLEETYRNKKIELEQKRTSQVFVKVQKVLADLYELLGEEEFTLSEFYSLFVEGLKAVTLATIPVSVDCVFVGEASNQNFTKTPYLFVLGAVDGRLPLEQQDVGLLLDDELNAMTETVKLEPSIQFLNKKAKFNLFQLLLLAQERLFVSYPRVSLKNAELKPSNIFSEFQKLFYIERENKKLPLPVLTLDDFLFTSELKLGENNWLPYYYANVEVAKNKWLKEVKEQNKLENSIYELLIKEFGKEKLDGYLKNFETQEEFPKLTNAQTLFFSKERTKISQLESYFMCPFKHFLDYGLKLKEKERAGVKAVDVGIILHKVAEEFGKHLKQQKGFTKNELTLITNQIMNSILNTPSYEFILLHKEHANMLESLKEEALRLVAALYYEQQNSNFKLSELEYEFDIKNPDTALKLKVNDTTISFGGVIDRIDFYENYFRIIDYKTGKSDFSFKELYYGKKIQLFIYASVVKLITGKTPAGVFYFPIKNEFDDSVEEYSLYKMQGAFLNNLAVVKAFDKTLSEEKSKSTLVPLTLKTTKTGMELDSYSVKRSFTQDEFEQIEHYAVNLSKQAILEILEGNITPSPYVDGKPVCDFCPYKNSCPLFLNLKNNERKISSGVTKETIKEAK